MTDTAPFLSRAPRSPWWERDDPQWDDPLTDPQWPSRSRGRTGRSGRRFRSVDEAFERLTRDRRRPHANNLLAAVGSWRHLNTGQLVAITGSSRNTVLSYARDLADAGLLEIAVRPQEADDVWRLPARQGSSAGSDPTAAALRRWVGSLTPGERFALTAGGDPGRGRRQSHRHDLVAAEIGLRLMEARNDLAAVFGETHASARAIFGTDQATAIADLCVVRGDGLRVAVEVVGHSTRTALTDKILRWARGYDETTARRAAANGRALTPRDWSPARNSHHQTGVIVVFVNAATTHHDTFARNLRAAHADALTAAALSGSATPATRRQVALARTQILLADWTEWAPTARAFTTAFVSLKAWGSPDGTRWEPVNVLDDGPGGIPFHPDPPDKFTYPAAAAQLLAATPEWFTNQTSFHHPRHYQPGT